MMSSALETPDTPRKTLTIEDLEGVREPKCAAPGNGSRLDEDLTRPINDFVHHEDHHHRHDPEKRSTLATQTSVPVYYVSFLKGYFIS
jgi:hypothetical protein